MSKVRHLLRKLHIGGGGGGGACTDSHHHHHPPVVNSPSTPPPPRTLPFHTPSSPPALHTPVVAGDSADNSNSNSESVDFNFLEEEFQVQLALAISVSDRDAREDRDSAQIKAAEQISLGCSPSGTLAEFLSLKYWSYSVLNYDEKVLDGFYDVYGISSTSLAQGKMPLLVDLETILVSGSLDYEVIIVNRIADLELQMLEEKVYSMYRECKNLENGLIMSGLIQQIADLVVSRMGGPVAETEEMSRKWNIRSHELQNTLNTIVLPLGCLDVGLSRHRALLFKVLSDRINLPCKLVKGSYCTGTDEGAVNFVKVDNGSEYIVDLMGAPGSLIPAEVPSGPQVVSGSEIRSMMAMSDNARDLCSVFSNGVGTVTVLPNSDILNMACVSKLKELPSFGTQSKIDGKAGNCLYENQSVNFEHEMAETSNNAEDRGSAIELTETTNHVPCITNSEKINQMLGGVSDWEIPWEDLHIGERIGIGSYGEVYRAECKGTEVAVKKFMNQDISGDALEQFKCEVEIMLRLRHPNVVLFMGAVTHPPNLSILTEFLPRGSLFKLLHRSNTQIDQKRRIRMALDVAKGMNYLHTSHPIIVHRDLKSPNLLVDRNWVVKVCDFGMSRMKHHTFLSSKSTAGTPEWMAPEVLRNEPSNEKSDVYSFGVILWELTTIRVPWAEMNSMQVVGAVGYQNRHLNIPAQVDPMVAEIITDCWNPDPQGRPSFGQIITRLRCLRQLLVEST